MQKKERGTIKKIKTNCVYCWKKIDVVFEPAVAEVVCLELECCRRQKEKDNQ